MSTYRTLTKNPKTDKFEMAIWHDDHFGRHHYGVEFPNGDIVDPELVKLVTKESNETVTGTATWHRYDTYEYTFPFNRWELFKWFVKGKAKIKWLVRADKKRKGIYIKGEKKGL